MADCPWTAQTCPVWVVLVNHQLLLVSSRNLHLIFGIFLHFIQNTQLFHICFRVFFLFGRKIKNNYDITKWEGFARTQTIQSLSYLEKFVLYRHPLCLPPHFPRDWQMILDRSTQGCGRLGPRRIHTHTKGQTSSECRNVTIALPPWKDTQFVTTVWVCVVRRGEGRLPVTILND